MKTKTVESKLGRFRSFTDFKGGMLYQSRGCLCRLVRVVDQNGEAVALPLYVDENGREEVAFHAKTVKSLVDFLDEGAKISHSCGGK